MGYRVIRNNLYHHGMKGQHWGERNGPPYPLNRTRNGAIIKSHVRFKMPEMSKEDFIFANELWKKNREYEPIHNSKSAIYSAMTNNLTTEEKELPFVHQTVGDFDYTAINKGHEQYKLLSEKRSNIPKGRPRNIVDEVLIEMFGPYYEEDYNDK